MDNFSRLISLKYLHIELQRNINNIIKTNNIITISEIWRSFSFFYVKPASMLIFVIFFNVTANKKKAEK
jgi:hypothetical protein